MELKNIEFSALPDGEVEIRFLHKVSFILSEKDHDFVTAMYSRIREDYPQAFKNLCDRYVSSVNNKQFFEFRVVKGFIKCNFSRLDNKMDIDENGVFHLEYIPCPLAGECKEWKETCDPKMNTGISEAETRVLRLIVQGKQTREIADLLCISPKTVENHTNNMLRKLNVHNNASLVHYWHSHNMK